MGLASFTARIKDAATRAGSEAKLEGELNQILKECLAEFGVDFDPRVNESLIGAGLAQVDAGRPDGVFGHIVYDYKAPATLSSPRKLASAKRQLERYLDRITGGHDHHAGACSAWFGYVCDGNALAYCRSDSVAWQWSPPLPVNESTLLLLVHAYRSLSRKPLTSELLSRTFGKESDVAIPLVRAMCSRLAKPTRKTEMLFREWRRLFEQVSTYELDQLPSLKDWASDHGIKADSASHILFALHSYYSLVVKLVSSELLAISRPEMPSVCQEIVATGSVRELQAVVLRLEDSEYYRRYRVSNFLEGDFFSWYTEEMSASMAQALRAVAGEFLNFEPASAILLPRSKKDLLKEFYSSLLDEQIRHDLGEYYTPDWLAQHLLDRAGYAGQPDQTVLDPTCGSGTFLIECIIRLRKQCEDRGFTPLETLETVLENVKGLDLNPLAVISARANYILAIYDLVFELGHDIELPVYLADSINLPIERQDGDGERYFEYALSTEIEDFVLEFPSALVDSQLMAPVLLSCESAIRHGDGFDRFLRAVRRQDGAAEILTRPVIERLRRFFDAIQSLESRDWDRIWCRIVKNNFSPKGFGKFDLIVGNPPWVRWSRLPKAYRARVKDFCNHYGLVSGRGYSGGIESDISTVVTFSAADNWLREGGTLAFLITWTVFKSASARGFRLGRLPDGSGLKVKHIEDMTRLRPFPDAANETAVYIAEKVGSASRASFRRVRCDVWEPAAGKASVRVSSTLAEARSRCHIRPGAACPVGAWGTPWFTGDAAHYEQSAFLRGSSDYRGVAHRGTISDCARVYWVKVLRYSPKANRALIRTLTEQELPRARAVAPVQGMWIEADLLYPLIRGRDVGRYCSETEDWYQIVPNRHYDAVATEEAFADRYPLAYEYFRQYRDVLAARSSYKRYQKHLPFYVIYCVGDYSFSGHKVVWMEQQNPGAFRASVISTDARSRVPNQLVVPDHKLYFASCSSADEAHYLCGFLNAPPVRTWLGGFLLGKQIGTSVFEHMRVPPFDAGSEAATAIAKLSREAHEARARSRDRSTLRDEKEQELATYVQQVCREAGGRPRT